MSNKYILIGKPTVTDGYKVIWPLKIDGNSDKIIITVSDNVAPYLTVDRIDAIVTGLLIFAARNGYNFKSDIPITDELLYNISHHLIPAISTKAHSPQINAPTITPASQTGKIVATGISCGVDSLYTIATHTDLPNSDGNINYLSFFDAGSHGTDAVSIKIKEGRRALAKQFAQKYGLNYFEVTSNLPEIIEKNTVGGYSHLENHTFMMAHCILTLYKGIHRYYYSAAYDYTDFNCVYTPDGEFDSAYYDLLTLMSISYGNIRFYSSGGEVSRLKKVELLSSYKPATESLNVCIEAVENDNICFKCVRTLLEIDALGVLDRFNIVFDINYYRQHRTWYLEQAYIEALKGDLFTKELLPYFKKDMTPWFKLRALARKIISVIKNRL